MSCYYIVVVGFHITSSYNVIDDARMVVVVIVVWLGLGCIFWCCSIYAMATITWCESGGGHISFGDFVGGGLVARQGTLKNSIVGGNVPDQITGEYGFPSLTVSYCCVQGGFAGVGNIDADPLFLDPAHHNYRLLPGSPCIDAGDNTGVPAWLDLDRRGWPRFLDDPFTVDTGVPGGLHPVVDMGAYEYGWRLRRTGDRRPPIAPPRRFD